MYRAGVSMRRERLGVLLLQKQLKSFKLVQQTCGGPPLVNNLQVFPVQEVTGARLPCQHHGGHVLDDLLLLAFCHGREPLLQTQLPLATEEQQEAHLTTQRRSGGSEWQPGRLHEPRGRLAQTHTHTMSLQRTLLTTL